MEKLNPKDTEISNIIQKYFSSPWGKLSPKEEGEIEELVSFPMKDPKSYGGLTKKGEEWAKQRDLKNLLELSKKHQEKTRVEVHATIKSAWLYAKSHERELDEEEKNALLAGIAISSSLDRMQTVKKGGKLLAAGFVDKLSVLYKGLVKNNKNSQNQDYITILQKAANLHKNAEKKDKEVSNKILNI